MPRILSGPFFVFVFCFVLGLSSVTLTATLVYAKQSSTHQDASIQNGSCDQSLIFSEAHNNPGNSVTIPVVIDTNGVVVGSLGLTVAYDNSLLTFDSVDMGSLVDNQSSALVQANDNPVAGAVQIGLIDPSGFSGTGSVLELSFTLDNQAQAGSCSALEVTAFELTDLSGSILVFDTNCITEGLVCVTIPVDVTMQCLQGSVEPGAQFTIPVSINTAGGSIGGLDVTFSFDDSVLSAVGAEPVGLAAGATVQPVAGSNEYRIGLIENTGFSGSGEVLEVTFAVNSNLTQDQVAALSLTSASVTNLFDMTMPASVDVDQCSVQIDYCCPDGDVAPLGSADGQISVADALVALRFALNMEPGHPTSDELCHADVAPLDASDQPDPDGQLSVADALIILRKALGMVSFSCP